MEIKVTKTAPVYDIIGLSEEELMTIRHALNVMVDIDRMTFGGVPAILRSKVRSSDANRAASLSFAIQNVME